MPYVKKSNRKNNNKNKVLSTKQVANIAKRAIHKEAETKMKSQEVSAQAIGPDDAGYINNGISTIAQGSDNENRVGDSLLQTGLQFRYFIENNGGRHYMVRVILFKTRKDEYNNASTSEFLLSTANEPLTLTANDQLDIVRSFNRKSIGKVLYDRVHQIADSASTNGYATIFNTKFFKLGNKKVHFPKDSATETDYDNIRMLCIVRDASGGAIAAGNDIKFTLMTRYYYKDF